MEPALVSIFTTGFAKSTVFVAGRALAVTRLSGLPAAASAGFEEDRLQPANPPAANRVKMLARHQNRLKCMREIPIAFDI